MELGLLQHWSEDTDNYGEPASIFTFSHYDTEHKVIKPHTRQLMRECWWHDMHLNGLIAAGKKFGLERIDLKNCTNMEWNIWVDDQCGGL